jgi:hypothetical protein
LAENKDTTRQEFPEVQGKIVDSVGISVEADYYGIDIRFQDKTSLTFAIEPCVFAFPAYAQWTGGEEKILKQYEAVRSTVSRE